MKYTHSPNGKRPKNQKSTEESSNRAFAIFLAEGGLKPPHRAGADFDKVARDVL